MTCFSRCKVPSGCTVPTTTFRRRCTSVLPPVEPEKPSLYVVGGLGGAGVLKTCWKPLPSLKSIRTVIVGFGAGETTTLTVRLALASVVPPSVPGNVDVGLFGGEVGTVVLAGSSSPTTRARAPHDDGVRRDRPRGRRGRPLTRRASRAPVLAVVVVVAVDVEADPDVAAQDAVLRGEALRVAQAAAAILRRGQLGRPVDQVEGDPRAAAPVLVDLEGRLDSQRCWYGPVVEDITRLVVRRVGEQQVARCHASVMEPDQTETPDTRSVGRVLDSCAGEASRPGAL